MKLKASEVFVPGGFPTHTFVERADDRLEQRISDALEQTGILLSVSGPSKAGKTVLLEKVIGRDNLISVTGAGVSEPEEIWERALNWMDLPTERSSVAGSTTGKTEGAGAAIGANIPFVAKAEGTLKTETKTESKTEEMQKRSRGGLSQVIQEIKDSDYVLLIDDFHYVAQAAQIELMRQIKELVRNNVKVCVASVMHRADQAIRANQEMQGRISVIDLKYWETDELIKIATQGFAKLNLKLDENLINKLAIESAGSPQLMQTLCLQTCRTADHRDRTVGLVSKTLSPDAVSTLFEDASQTMDFRSLVDTLDCGPKERGRERKVYGFQDGAKGDVYRCILKCIAMDPPRLSFEYDELVHRAAALCDREAPSGSSIQGSCEHMVRLARDQFPAERQIDWNKDGKEVLDIAEPYLLFYLRWSGRLDEANE